ncbi:hypothetical protein [Rhodocytophaga rosea]|nr:hypothetical protein [Rhodocytophaga rosea]
MGNTRRVMLSSGQVHNLRMAAGLIEDEQTANKAYNSDQFIAFIE